VTDDVTRRLREQIAARDRAVLEAVNARLRLVAELREHKEQTGAAFVDRAQEERLLRALEDANAGPLSDAGVRRLFEAILAVTKEEVARESRA
jgi:chorismate mutase